jgi:DNA-binding transcriptional regulator YiaG
LALLIEDITLLKTETIAVQVRFRGGRTTVLTVEAPRSIASIRKFNHDLLTQLDQLLETCTDQEAAEQLNTLGYRNWKEQPFTAIKVTKMRFAYKITSRLERLRKRGLLSAQVLARRFGVSVSTIHEWGKAGWLPRQHYDPLHCLYEPVKSLTIRRGKAGRLIPSVIRVPLSQQETV